MLDIVSDDAIVRGNESSQTQHNTTQQFIAALKAKDFSIELFDLKEVLVNITEHTLVPKHQVLSEAEKKNVLEKYKMKEGQLPKIQVNDPVARFYGLSRGQVRVCGV